MDSVILQSPALCLLFLLCFAAAALHGALGLKSPILLLASAAGALLTAAFAVLFGASLTEAATALMAFLCLFLYFGSRGEKR